MSRAKFWANALLTAVMGGAIGFVVVQVLLAILEAVSQ